MVSVQGGIHSGSCKEYRRSMPAPHHEDISTFGVNNVAGIYV
jgi:hypothetical protein